MTCAPSSSSASYIYCSLFPKGTTIKQGYIVPMWISKGFVQPQDASSSQDDRLEEEAIKYYQELINRNLIEPTEGAVVYQCTMHDMVRTFAEFMAREDSLVVRDREVAATGGGSSNDNPVRRMSVGPSTLVPEWAVLPKQDSLRTLIITNCKINFEPNDSSLTGFSRLRVLSIQGGDCDRLVGSLSQLRHLRYLCLDQTNISSLPDDIEKMKFLRHILLRWSRNLRSLP